MINPQPSIDPYTNQLLAVRYRYRIDSDTTETRIVVFPLAAARHHRPTLADRLVERHLPDLNEITAWPVPEPKLPALQGFSVCGRYGYPFHGNAGAHEHSYIVAIDLNHREATRQAVSHLRWPELPSGT
jgi:hypothetical protein